MYAYENTPASDLPEFIRQFEAKRLNAIHENDAGTLRQLLTDGFIYVRENGEVVSRERYLSRIADGELVYSFDTKFQYQHSYQERFLFIILGLVTGEIPLNGERIQRRLRSTSTWFQHEVGWQSLIVQMTPVAPGIKSEIEPDAERKIRVQ